jgi:ribose transport system permease protein
LEVVQRLKAVRISESLRSRASTNGKMATLKALIPLLVLAALSIGIGVISPRFLTLSNFVRVSSSAAVPLILVCGMTFIILIGSIDLSVEGNLAVAAVTVGQIGSQFSDSPWILLVFPLVTLLGALIGFLNGAVHVYLRVPSLLTSLGFGFAGLGVATLFVAGGSITITDSWIRGAAFYRLLGLPMAVWIASCALLAALYIQTYTRLGRWAYVLGGGEDIAVLSGIPVRRVRIALFTLAGAFFGLAGGILAAQLGLAQIQITTGYLFTSITGVVVGGTALTGGVGGILNSIVGVFVVTVLANGMVLMGIPTAAQLGVQGILTVMAVATSLDRKRLASVK